MLENWCLRRQPTICSTDKVGVQAEDGSDEYGGSKPFSEPESRIVRLLAENTRPQVSPLLHMNSGRGIAGVHSPTNVRWHQKLTSSIGCGQESVHCHKLCIPCREHGQWSYTEQSSTGEPKQHMARADADSCEESTVNDEQHREHGIMLQQYHYARSIESVVAMTLDDRTSLAPG